MTKSRILNTTLPSLDFGTINTMSTHNAVVTTSIRAPLAIVQVPTVQPVEREVLIRVEWTASTPLDLHQNDGGLLVQHPQILGDGIAGTVLKIGLQTRNLVVGDKVNGHSRGSKVAF